MMNRLLPRLPLRSRECSQRYKIRCLAGDCRTWSYLAFLIAILVALSSCKSSQQTAASKDQQQADSAETAVRKAVEKDVREEQEAEKPRWAPKKYHYNPAHHRKMDLLHTTLRVRFDWQRQWLHGEAVLRLKPHFVSQDSLILNAKGFEIKQVALHSHAGGHTALNYRYDGKRHLRIALDRRYTRQDSFEVFIKYIAKPNELEPEGEGDLSGGKGLYFIDPLDEDPYKPTELWTQGETDGNSAWFPTIDHPNERCTQEMFIRVQDQYTTLSNGSLVERIEHEDGTRTDHWRMELPHAPYLFMMAVGDFAVVEDDWRGRPVTYYVEPDYGPYARDIFGMTPAMMTFYSRAFGVEFPWSKYGQVVIRDFVAGAMENTTATTCNEGFHQTRRGLLDNNPESTIAHELVHQWFGDLVTCESWANLALNESFATYGSKLWMRHRYGQDRYEHNLRNDLNAYLAEARQKREPIIRYYYKDSEQMFDRHSYSKGSRVLYMLHTMLGDTAFYKSLQHYLRDNAYSPVEIDELRLAFEEVTGQDLKWFFQQWFLEAGHAELVAEYPDTLAAGGQEVHLRAKQTQDTRYQPMYRLPMTIEVATDRGKLRFERELRTADTVFVLKLPSAARELRNIDLDSQHYLLASVEETNKPDAWWRYQFAHAENYAQRVLALNALKINAEAPENFATIKSALQDTFPPVRQKAISALRFSKQAKEPAILNQMKALAQHDPNAGVRAASLSMLADLDQTKHPALKAVYRKALNDSSYRVAALALNSLHGVDSAAGLQAARQLKDLRSNRIRQTVSQIFMDHNAPEALDYVPRAIHTTSGMEQMGLLQSFGDYASKLEDEADLNKAINLLKDLASGSGTWFSRWAAIQSLSRFNERPAVQSFIEQRIEEEKNPRLKRLLEQQFGS